MGKLPKGDFPFLVCCGIMTMISDIWAQWKFSGDKHKS